MKKEDNLSEKRIETWVIEKKLFRKPIYVLKFTYLKIKDVKEFFKQEDDLITLLMENKLSNAEFCHKRSKLIGKELR